MRRIQTLLTLILSLSWFAVPAVFTAPSTWSQVVNNQSINLITSTPIPTPSISEQPAQETVTRGRPPLGLTLFLLSLCCFFLLLIGVFILGIVVRRQNPNNK